MENLGRFSRIQSSVGTDLLRLARVSTSTLVYLRLPCFPRPYSTCTPVSAPGTGKTKWSKSKERRNEGRKKERKELLISITLPSVESFNEQNMNRRVVVASQPSPSQSSARRCRTSCRRDFCRSRRRPARRHGSSRVEFDRVDAKAGAPRSSQPARHQKIPRSAFVLPTLFNVFA